VNLSATNPHPQKHYTQRGVPSGERVLASF
jgi:hypothetical protein